MGHGGRDDMKWSGIVGGERGQIEEGRRMRGTKDARESVKCQKWSVGLAGEGATMNKVCSIPVCM